MSARLGPAKAQSAPDFPPSDIACDLVDRIGLVRLALMVTERNLIDRCKLARAFDGYDDAQWNLITKDNATWPPRDTVVLVYIDEGEDKRTLSTSLSRRTQCPRSWKAWREMPTPNASTLRRIAEGRSYFAFSDLDMPCVQCVGWLP